MAATLAAPQASGPGRISQLLPTVKCSNCNDPVPLADLGEHVCAPQTPSHANLASKITRLMSPGSSAGSAKRRSTRTSFSTMRTRSTSNASSIYSDFSSAIPPVPTPPLPNTAPPSHTAFPASPPRPSYARERSNSNASSISRSSRTPPPPSHTPTPTRRSPGPTRSPAPVPPSSPPVPLSSSPAPISRTGTPQPSKVPFPHSRADAHLSSQPYIISTHSPRPPPGPPPVDAANPPSSPFTAHFPRPTPSHHPSSPSFPNGPLPPGSPRQQPASLPMNVPQAPQTPQPRFLGLGHQQTDSIVSTHGGMTRSPEPDTQTGGEAGMAGVGRRGFAAVASAALFVMPRTQGPSSPGYSSNPNMMAGQGNQPQAVPARPQFLDIAAIHRAAGLVGPNGSTLSPVSPRSPISSSSPSTPKSPVTPHTPDGFASSNKLPGSLMPGSPGGVPAALLAGASKGSPLSSAPKETSDTYFPSQAKDTPAPEFTHTRTLSVSSDGSELGLAYAQSTDIEDEDVEAIVTRAQSVRKSRSFVGDRARRDSASSSVSSGSGSGRRGLLIRKGSQGAPGEGDVPPLPISPKKDSELEAAFNAVAALSEPVSPMVPMPSTSSTLMKPHAPLRSNTVQGITTPKNEVDLYDSFPSKLPMRSNTERASSSHHHHGKENGTAGLSVNKGAATKGKSRVRVCASCDKRIDDGRWIQIDGEEGKKKVSEKGVLCEGCWKGMYLPKCRRCQLPIEKQAISSSDGQLKGKYHKECFTCFECSAPFPNKTFYVLNDQALCAYHYALHNRSLCSSSACGQPIEGPCAVDHTGARYHPEHFLCQRANCSERLKDYFEVDGKMVCERHAQITFRQSRMFGVGSRKSRAWGLSMYGADGVYDGLDEVPEDDVSEYDSETEGFDDDSEAWKAMKRTTRFIDLRLSKLSEEEKEVLI
ncbi:hypothetical protein V5O48_004123 [Marasmius crinis-equi]|uniref:LIM zinc-binding domain-containing protein n=1 Tax=Marasmius crinis-equi TaxID=585013 RepID=A0ABR3FR25_9AGAR